MATELENIVLVAMIFSDESLEWNSTFLQSLDRLGLELVPVPEEYSLIYSREVFAPEPKDEDFTYPYPSIIRRKF